MKKRRKHSRCLNCSEPLDRSYNFCPICGQENTDNNISISTLIKEFASNFFSLDSRFSRTFKPFLFSPGKVTNEFLSGKRVLYANPIRWYLVITLIHFFFMSRMFQPSVEDTKERTFFNEEIVLTTDEFDSLYHLPDTVDSWLFSDEKKKLVNHLVSQTTLSEDQIYDTLRFDRSWFNELATKKAIKLSRETTASINTYILKQVPIIIFFLLPVYAFLLKLFFWKKVCI